MKLLFYDTKSYDRASFDEAGKRYPDIAIEDVYKRHGEWQRGQLRPCGKA